MERKERSRSTFSHFCEKRSGAGGFFIYVVLCQDFVQIKMRQFSVFNLPGALLMALWMSAGL